MPVIIGDLQLPSNARLRLYKNLNVTLQPLEYTTLAATDNAGILILQLSASTRVPSRCLILLILAVFFFFLICL